MDKALLVEGAVLAQSAVEGAAETGAGALKIERAGNVALVEERGNLVAHREARHARADGDDLTGTVRGGDDVVPEGERVHAPRDDEITVVEGGGVDWGMVNCCCGGVGL